MTNKEPKPLFTKNYIKLIKLARELNENKKISGDLYFHPQESKNKVIVKTINLSSKNPLIEVNSVFEGKQDWEERWIEAYLINQSKKNKWVLDLAEGKYQFIASQFTFRKRQEWDGTKHVDLILYDEGEKHLLVLELKADTGSFSTAKSELDIYIKELKHLIKNEGAALGDAFGLKKICDVIGYVVCPILPYNTDVQKLGLGELGIITYEKPWIEKGFEKYVQDLRDTKHTKVHVEFASRKPVEF